MIVIKAIVFICLAAASKAASDQFICRFRVSNVSADLADRVRSSSFRPVLEVSGTSGASFTQLGVDVGDDPTMAEVIFKKEKASGDQFIAVKYKDIGIPVDRVTLRCSRISSTGNNEFNESYVFNLRPPVLVDGDHIRRAITVNRQSQVDCYFSGGYVDPYTLEGGDRYLSDGERFETGCSMVGQCRNGGISGVSRCPPQIFPPTIDEVRNVGQCCDHGVSKATVEAKGCPKNEDRIAFRFPATSQRESQYRPVLVPWQVRFGKTNGDLRCDGVIINRNWFLTTQSCLNDVTDIEVVRPYSVGSTGTIVEVKKVDNDPKLDLALAKLSVPFVTGDWTTAIQKVNLPWSQAVCQKFLESGCHILLGTEERNVNVDSNVVVAVTGGGNQSQPRVRQIQKQQRWPVLLGSGAVSWYEKANFLVGIYVGNANTTVTGDKIRMTSTWKDDGVVGTIISVCPFLDVISQKVSG